MIPFLKAYYKASNFKTLISSIFLTYLITAGHHAYGAIIYETPWRNHIVSQGAVWLVVCLIFFGVYKYWKQKWAYWVFFILSIFFFFGALGLYEGFYNHVLKNTLFFGGVPESALTKLYPPPKYELPNDFIFELTGILTFFIASFFGIVLMKYSMQLVWRKQDNPNDIIK